MVSMRRQMQLEVGPSDNPVITPEGITRSCQVLGQLPPQPPHFSGGTPVWQLTSSYTSDRTAASGQFGNRYGCAWALLPEWT